MRELKGEKLEAELKRIEALKQYEKEYEHLGYGAASAPRRSSGAYN